MTRRRRPGHTNSGHDFVVRAPSAKSGAGVLWSLDRCICFGVAPFLRCFRGSDGEGIEGYALSLFCFSASREIPPTACLPSCVLLSLDPRCLVAWRL